jgi:hypothetical protein
MTARSLLHWDAGTMTSSSSRVTGSAMDDNARSSSVLFEDAVARLKQHYGELEFWVERDVVWTVQTHLRQMVAGRGLP